MHQPSLIRRAALAMLAALLIGASEPPPPPPPPDEIVLPWGVPLIDAVIAGVPVRLLVEPDAQNAVMLNADMRERLALDWRKGAGAVVGRERVEGVETTAPVTIGGRTVRLDLNVFDRDCCAGVDGMIGPAMLPYRVVRYVRASPPAGQMTVRQFPLVNSGATGSYVRVRLASGTLFVLPALTIYRPLTMAAGAGILAKDRGGQLVGKGRVERAMLGVSRPVRDMTLARPVELLGFPVSRVRVRVADFRGGYGPVPDGEEAEEADITVAGRRPEPQFGWTVLFLGAEQLDRCAELRYEQKPRTLTMTCDFG